MVKPALGKGMKDLLAKNIVLGEQETPVNQQNAKAELMTNIERYKAQEFDVKLLENLRGKPPEEVFRGIEDYREAVKKLISAQTVIRSLEGYGYNEEIDKLMKYIKDPSMADAVLEQAEELKDRALTEHNIKIEKKDVPKVKLSDTLKAQSEKLNNKGEDVALEEEISLDSLDGMLAELNEIGDALSFGEEESDPIMEEIRSWEAEGFFVDRLLNLLEEDRDSAIEEMKTFEQGILEMRVLKERFRKMDLSSFSKEQESIMLKFQYPHMASEIRNELDSIEKRIDDSLREAMGGLEEEEPQLEEEPEKEEAPAPEEELPEEEPKPPEEEPAVEEEEEVPEEIPAPEEVPEPEPEPEPEQEETPVGEVPVEEPEAPAEEIPPPEEVPEPAPEETPAEEVPAEEPDVHVEEPPVPEEVPEPGPEPEEIPTEEGAAADMDLDQLMDQAKEAYREGDLERSMEYFQEILNRDPDNSKARFMIRRLSSKQ